MEWAERLPLIEAIVRKDVRAAKWWFVVAIVLALVGFIMTTPMAANLHSMNARYGFGFQWNDPNLRILYGVVALLTSLLLGLAFSTVYTGEVRRGTIRSIILYPVDANDVILAKLASAFVIASLVSSIAFLGFTLPMFAYGVYPVADFLAIYCMTLFAGLVALATGVFLSMLIAHYTKRLSVSPSTLGGLFLLLALLLTEQVVTSIGTYLVVAIKPPRQVLTYADTQAIESFAKAISVLSPQHMGARILGDLFGVSNLWPDIHVVLPVFVIVVAAGYLVSRRIYLDVFVH